MAGIYIHIPFCHKACHYCDFHFSTNLRGRSEMIGAMKKELLLQKDFLEGDLVETIYFGGGTPSLLHNAELGEILNEVYNVFPLSQAPEITLEANPDDVNLTAVNGWTSLEINRLSLGIQSFYDEDLLWMNRSHSAQQALTAIDLIRDGGIENISVDLIYGYPLLTSDKWASNIEQLTRLKLPHLSCYSMTVEPGTALDYLIRNKKSPGVDDDEAADQLLYLMDFLEQSGYEHYEISNFCKPGKYSFHNTNYWRGLKYLGIGPSAHSYNGVARQSNVSNNATYLRSIERGTICYTMESLDENQKLNEYIMLNIRTIWGVNLNLLSDKFGRPESERVLQLSSGLLKSQHLYFDGYDTLRLTSKGKLVTDLIIRTLLV